MAEEAALKELTSNLGLVCNFTRESNVLNEQIFGRAFWKVENVICEVGAEGVEVVGEDEMEDISDERFDKMHKKGEMWEKKVDKKQQQSTRWQLRNEREMGKKKAKQQQKPVDKPRIRLGPDPQAATHLCALEDENVPVTVFGRVLPIMENAKPFELPWLKKPVNTKTKRKSSGLSMKPASKKLKGGGSLKNGVKKANVPESEAVDDISVGNDAEENNIEEEVGSHIVLLRCIYLRALPPLYTAIKTALHVYLVHYVFVCLVSSFVCV